MTKPDKKTKIILIITAAVLLICTALTIWIYRPPSGQRVFIIQDNQIIQEIYLDSARDQEIRIDAADGGYNLIQIQNHEIFMSHADCPDQTCVNMGVLKSENLPIVCLPHKLIIRFAEEGETP